MNAWDILAIVLCVAVIALVGFTIPILIQVKDLLKMAETTVNRIEKDVEPVLHNVEGITHNFEGLTGAANSFVHRPASTEPGMIDNIKESVTESVGVVRDHYVPLAVNEANRYLRALKIGFKVGLNKFRTSGRRELVNTTAPGLLTAPEKSSPIAEDIIIIDHQIIKR
jgi:uncharacterized protein YoxC